MLELEKGGLERWVYKSKTL